MKTKSLLLITFLLLVICNASKSQTFSFKEKGIFIPQNKNVFLFQDLSNKRIIIFKTNLLVNTDGTPISYHPYDLTGSTKAINTICNAIAVYKNGSPKNLCLDRKTQNEALIAIEKFRDSDFKTVPTGYSLIWKNVLVAEKSNGKEKPCIIKNGEYKGYFSSATSLKNDLSTSKGECDCENQVNPLKVPSLVLVGGKDNIVKRFGANLGDLLIAYNPANNTLVYAIISDSGPKNNLGEGSVLLNMLLSGKSIFPKTRKDSYNLSINGIYVTIIPDSKKLNIKKPYNADNIKTVIINWMKEAGFNTESDFISFIKKNNVQ